MSATASVLIIGNEVLSGRTRDANLPWLAVELGKLGLRLVETRIVRDKTEAIVEAVNDLRVRNDYVITTGGIGPTHDDITADAIAKAFGVELIRDSEAFRTLADHYGSENMNAARLKMAYLPEGAVPVANPVSGAAGFRIGNVFVLAGVPIIMQAMFKVASPQLTGGAPFASRTVSVDLPESLFAAELEQLQERFAEIEIGSYPVYGDTPGVALVMTGVDAARLDSCTVELMAAIRAIGGTLVD
ncbi:MAG: molybdopterin-binding protein [Pseudomonadota bacterium]|nr:molybdopterin-binding protein [Pseudomonadota bacterium]